MPIFNFYRFENKQVDNGPSFFAAEEAAEARFNQGKYQSRENVLEVSLLPSNAISYLS